MEDVIKSGPLKVIGQFSHDGIGCKTRVKCHWSVLLSFNPSIVSQNRKTVI